MVWTKCEEFLIAFHSLDIQYTTLVNGNNSDDDDNDDAKTTLDFAVVVACAVVVDDIDSFDSSKNSRWIHY